MGKSKKAMKYEEYIQGKEEDDVLFEYCGTITDMMGIYNIYCTMTDELGYGDIYGMPGAFDTFDYNKVHAVKKIEVKVDIDLVLAQLCVIAMQADREVDGKALRELKKSINSWNKKYGKEEYCATDTIVDIKEQLEKIIDESKDFKYSV